MLVLLQVGRYFDVKGRGSTFTTEIRAGLVTFLTSERARGGGAMVGAWGGGEESAQGRRARRSWAVQQHERRGLRALCLAAGCDAAMALQPPPCPQPLLPLSPHGNPHPTPPAAYILAVNSAILSQSGGTCSDADCTGPTAGQPGCRFNNDPGFLLCVVRNCARARTRVPDWGLSGRQ